MVTLESGLHGEPAMLLAVSVRASDVDCVTTHSPKMGDVIVSDLQRNSRRASMSLVRYHHLDQVINCTYFEFIGIGIGMLEAGIRSGVQIICSCR